MLYVCYDRGKWVNDEWNDKDRSQDQQNRSRDPVQREIINIQEKCRGNSGLLDESYSILKVISSESSSQEINCPLSMRVSFEEIDSILNCSSVSVSLIMFRSRKCT